MLYLLFQIDAYVLLPYYEGLVWLSLATNSMLYLLFQIDAYVLLPYYKGLRKVTVYSTKWVEISQ